MSITTQEKQMLIDLTKKYYDIGVDYITKRNQLHLLENDKVVFPEITFDLKGKAAGQFVINYKTKHRKIRYNPEIFKHNKELFEQTVLHKVFLV